MLCIFILPVTEISGSCGHLVIALHDNIAPENKSDDSLWNNKSLGAQENKWLNEREMQVNLNISFKIYTSNSTW